MGALVAALDDGGLDVPHAAASLLGSCWAYYELGWGGWWFWDPVENASFMPWLVGTALIHSLAVTEKRGAFKSWTVLLAIVTFSLSLLGTFLVRSGVLTSVHAFATDPGARRVHPGVPGARGRRLAAAVRAGARRASALGGRFELVSRESLLLANNVLLTSWRRCRCCSARCIRWSLDALGLGKISVGPPYFEAVFVPLMAPALFLMGVGPMARWKHAPLPELARRLRWALAASGAAALLLPLTLPAGHAAGRRCRPSACCWRRGRGERRGASWLRLRGAPGGWLERVRRQPRGW